MPLSITFHEIVEPQIICSIISNSYEQILNSKFSLNKYGSIFSASQSSEISCLHDIEANSFNRTYVITFLLVPPALPVVMAKTVTIGTIKGIRGPPKGIGLGWSGVGGGGFSPLELFGLGAGFALSLRVSVTTRSDRPLFGM